MSSRRYLGKSKDFRLASATHRRYQPSDFARREMTYVFVSYRERDDESFS